MTKIKIEGQNNVYSSKFHDLIKEVFVKSTGSNPKGWPLAERSWSYFKIGAVD